MSPADSIKIKLSRVRESRTCSQCNESTRAPNRKYWTSAKNLNGARVSTDLLMLSDIANKKIANNSKNGKPTESYYANLFLVNTRRLL